jgi:hypothetical protein
MDKANRDKFVKDMFILNNVFIAFKSMGSFWQDTRGRYM